MNYDDDVNFKIHSLGQFVLQFECPDDAFIAINDFYENNIEKFSDSSAYLVGKIKTEKRIFSVMSDEPLSSEVPDVFMKWLQECFDVYLEVVGSEYPSQKILNSIWINDALENEYNPVHYHRTHQSTVGLSSVLMLKKPESYGEEIQNPQIPFNGRLEILSNSVNQFSCMSLRPEINEKDFYIFPYDVRHCVYPFFGSGIRRTLSANFDVLPYYHQELDYE